MEGVKTVALAGNPNVGKSTIFNRITGLNQHTGNWSGKTVNNAQGVYTFNGRHYIIIDAPGTYSLSAQSRDEEAARDIICFGGVDAIVVVCDALCMERNLNLALQIREITGNVIVCVNLIDEAIRKGVKLDLDMLSESMGVPVVGICARNGEGMEGLLDAIANMCTQCSGEPFVIDYPHEVERAITALQRKLNLLGIDINRWAALKLLEGGFERLGISGRDMSVANTIRCHVTELTYEDVKDAVATSIMRKAENICSGSVQYTKDGGDSLDLRVDRIVLGRYTAVPLMVAALAIILWITISGANYPSQWLAQTFFIVQNKLLDVCLLLNIPWQITEPLVMGVFRVCAWVVSVMLPPMAIFFPLFAILEDLGYLPRVAFNMDGVFKRCNACGKQALTMCMACKSLL